MSDARAARIVRRWPLHFAAGADAGEDRPAHVRAGSGLAVVGRGLAVVQDDANFIALVDPVAPSAVRAIALPRGEGGRRLFADATGNKRHKMDLESCFVAPEGRDGAPMLVALGSGSTNARESVVFVHGIDGDAPTVRVHDARHVFAALRATHEFAGSALNVEGCILRGDTLRLFSRGNGRARDGRQPVNATCDLDWRRLRMHLERPTEVLAPTPERVRRLTLGTVDGVALGFTDAMAFGDRDLFLAVAERSADEVQDGPVEGALVGVLAEDGELLATPLLDERGAPVREKPEGVVAVPGSSRELWVVADTDDVNRPSELWRVRLEGAW